MKIASQGYIFIGLGLAGVALGWLAAYFGWSRAGLSLAGLGLLFAGFCAYFFRDPERPAPSDPAKLYSPGDGRVLSVAREGPSDIVTVRIFLSIFDVHVQRAPTAGVVEKVVYQKGSFRAAMLDEARANERCVMTLKPEGRSEPVVVEQIAGLIARRIECWPKPGDQLSAGQRYGIIYFGSQAALHLPGSARCLVKPGDRAVAGMTPIAEWKN
ncbi:MAG: phosphatidylserine decarboxylase [Elusimicrobia bacterium]|nr:phosphatidylserine decarboxylase [Elusimicrobiota bacterium]